MEFFFNKIAGSAHSKVSVMQEVKKKKQDTRREWRKDYQRKRREKETSEDKKKRKLKDAERVKRKRKFETLEEKKKRQKANLERKKQKCKNETEEETKARRRTEAKNQKKRRKLKKKKKNNASTEKQSLASRDKNQSNPLPKDVICVICKVAKLDSYVLPCGHSHSCFSCAKHWLLNMRSTCPFCKQEVKVLTAWNTKERTIIAPKGPSCDEDIDLMEVEDESVVIDHCTVCGEEESKENMIECHFCEEFMHEECERQHDCESDSENFTTDSEFSESCFDAESFTESPRKKRKLSQRKIKV